MRPQGGYQAGRRAPCRDRVTQASLSGVEVMSVPETAVTESDQKRDAILAQAIAIFARAGFRNADVHTYREARRDIVEYVKTLSPRFAREAIDPGDVLEIPPGPPVTAGSLETGAGIYRRRCSSCHGQEGRVPYA